MKKFQKHKGSKNKAFFLKSLYVNLLTLNGYKLKRKATKRLL